MDIRTMPDDLARTYLQRNGITGAFIWDDRPSGWSVYLGTPEDTCGWKEAEGLSRRAAKRLAAELNARIAALLP